VPAVFDVSVVVAAIAAGEKVVERKQIL